jgi:alkylation response protein AidB-like acyl-CoA dehydrogenase
VRRPQEADLDRSHVSHRVGGAFLLEPACDARIFTPEDFTEDQRALYRTAAEFSTNEVTPRAKDIENKAPGVLVGLLKKAGELGFLMIDIPEAYGGLGLTKVTSMLATEALRRVGSFSVTVGAHTGIGTLPIVYYGTEEQKKKYLPRLATGEWVAAYALTEAGSGSDALAARATAVQKGEEWVLNGVKQWITNGAFADLYTVFAKVDGEHFTAFLVERTTPGVSVGPEEHKMGIRGSSTTEVILQDVHIPAGNVLGTVGRGHKIAFNILNVGRLKLGIGTVGASKQALQLAVEYAKQRKQFGRAISEFGLIRLKIGHMATRIFVGESMGYRTAGLIDAAIKKEAGLDHPRTIEEYAIESSILKIFGSECLDYVADEAVQIHGGYGFTEHYEVERIRRDSRINRIFEGTNEINRLLIPAMLFKKAMKGELPLLDFVRHTKEQIAGGSPFTERPRSSPLYNERRATEVGKRVVAYMAAMALEKHMTDLQDKQEIVGALADAIIDVYAMESSVARTLQAIEKEGAAKTKMMQAMTRIFVHDAHERLLDMARLLAAEMCEGDELERTFREISRFPERYPIKYYSEVDAVAAQVIEDGKYRLGLG